MASEVEIKEQGKASTSLFGWINRRKVQKSAASLHSEDTGDQPLITKRDSDESYAWSAVILPKRDAPKLRCDIHLEAVKIDDGYLDLWTTYQIWELSVYKTSRFLFPALGGLLYGYDIGATSGADISLESAELSGTDWYNMSSIANGVVAMHSAPLYIAETSPSQIRGRLISLKEFFIVLGMLLGYLVSSLAVDAIGGWRYMYGASIPLTLIMALGMWWLPPSPRWILLCAVQGKGNLEELKIKAASILCRLRGRTVGDMDSDEQIEENIRCLQDVYPHEEKEASIWELFQGSSRKALIIGAGLVFFQQVTGQPSVLYYAATILESAGFSAASDATRVSILIGFFKLLMTGIAVLTVDKLGRRPLLIIGVSGMAVSLFLLAAYYAFLGNAPVVAVISLLLYVGCYQASFGPIGWLMISEIFPLRTRGRGLSIAVLVNFSANALVTFSFSPLRALLGAAILFLIFGIIDVVAFFFIIFVVPETKGMTLEEIESKILK